MALCSLISVFVFKANTRCCNKRWSESAGAIHRPEQRYNWESELLPVYDGQYFPAQVLSQWRSKPVGNPEKTLGKPKEPEEIHEKNCRCIWEGQEEVEGDRKSGIRERIAVENLAVSNSDGVCEYSGVVFEED